MEGKGGGWREGVVKLDREGGRERERERERELYHSHSKHSQWECNNVNWTLWYCVSDVMDKGRGATRTKNSITVA